MKILYKTGNGEIKFNASKPNPPVFNVFCKYLKEKGYLDRYTFVLKGGFVSYLKGEKQWETSDIDISILKKDNLDIIDLSNVLYDIYFTNANVWHLPLDISYEVDIDNPANLHINYSIKNPTLDKQFIRIYYSKAIGLNISEPPCKPIGYGLYQGLYEKYVPKKHLRRIKSGYIYYSPIIINKYVERL